MVSEERSDSRRGRRIIDGARRAAHAGLERVRRHRRASLALLLALVFLAGPGYTASRPDFYERFEDLSAYHETWSQSTHANVSCQSCHVSPRVLDQVVYGARMIGESYLSLLPLDREPRTLSRPTNAACDSCHVELREVSPAGDLRIPHLAHVGTDPGLGLECVVCHDELLTHAEDPTVPNITTPRMSRCLECHDGERAKQDCEACHTEKPVPESHQDPQFIVVHADLRDEIDCESCHAWRDEWCLDCHTRRPNSHGTGVNPSEWRAEHREVVGARQPRNCEACHEAPFCIECHGEVPQLNLDPALTLAR